MQKITKANLNKIKNDNLSMISKDKDNYITDKVFIINTDYVKLKEEWAIEYRINQEKIDVLIKRMKKTIKDVGSSNMINLLEKTMECKVADYFIWIVKIKNYYFDIKYIDLIIRNFNNDSFLFTVHDDKIIITKDNKIVFSVGKVKI